jgi:hypothetical protein
MKSYIFITTEGYTYQPESKSPEPDIENCQVIGFAQGNDEHHAFANLSKQNPSLLETTFNELICLELKHMDYFKNAQHFYLSELTVKARNVS